MRYQFNDGGRAEAGYKGSARDCVCRAIAIATERPYREVYEALNALGEGERIGKRKNGKSSARTGVYKPTIRRYMESIGWRWVPTMKIGQGCKVHLADGELPQGRLVVNVSKHSTAVIDGVIHDTHDPSRGGTRCVYGYYTAIRSLLIASVLLAASAARGEILATYSASLTAMSTEPVGPYSQFRLELLHGDTLLQYAQLPYRAYEAGVAYFALRGPDFLHNQDADEMTFRMLPVSGGTPGEFAFDETDLSYDYPHAGVDFGGSAVVKEIGYRIRNVSTQGQNVNATVEWRFVGMKIAEVPEPATWALVLVGLALVYYLKVHRDRTIKVRWPKIVDRHEK